MRAAAAIVAAAAAFSGGSLSFGCHTYVVFSVKNTSIIEVDYCNFIGGSGCNFLSICENNLGYF